MVRLLPVVVLLAVTVGAHRTASGQADPFVARAVQYLRGVGGGGGVGQAALAGLALVKADVPAKDPSVAKPLALVLTRFTESQYKPEGGSGVDVYEAAVVVLFLVNLDASAHRAEIEAAAQYLLGRQNANGSWDYLGRPNGDTSISQYAVLGLWEAENAGVAVAPSVWDRAAIWYMSVQDGAGGWNYHRDSPMADTIAMTAAGVGSLLICDRQLAPYRAAVRVAHPLMVPLSAEGERKRYIPEAGPQKISQSVRAGIGWLAANFTTGNPQLIGHSPYYALYGIERIGGLADQATLGRRDWFAEGQRFLASTQRGDGSFSSSYGEGPNTSWAILFLTKSTAKSIRKIQVRRLGAGTLIGGRGLPRDLSQISVAGGHVVARPMDGAIEGMLAALEDPRVEDASTALAGLVGRYRTEGPAALRPFEDRFRKLLTDPDQGVRRVAAWSLARTGDLAMVPPLLGALRDPDEAVVVEARLGLQLLSRKIEGFGPAPSATPEQREAAIARWREWFEATRPLAGSDEEPASPGPSPAPPKPADPARRTP